VNARTSISRPGPLGFIFGLLGFAAVAAGMALMIPAVPGDGTPTSAAATPPLSGDSVRDAPAPVAEDGPAATLAAMKNTQEADAPPYKPGVQRVVIDVFEKEMEIASGKVVKVWTFGPKVPGPVIRVRVGDTVQATLRNRGSIPHSIDFHAARIAPNRAFRDISPGKSFTFSFTATMPGVFMYHCGTTPVVHHIANGMYGMIIVEPPGGLPPVDREFAFVQSDFYVGSPGSTADNDKLMDVQPDVIAFNGYAAQYKDHPIQVKRGERLRAFVLAAGPNTWSAFHVVGTIFDRAWIDGIHPENLSIGNQTLNLAASQGAVAEFTLSEDGTYPFVSHDFTSAAKGAVGLFVAGPLPHTRPGH
jgi:nitrite reductase (NO-forming)